jgi:tRNA A-37 threonylcarbamoyl transferase component Bud32
MGNVYLQMNNLPEALKYYQRSLAIAYDIENKKLISVNLTNIGNIYKDLNEYDKSLAYSLKSLHMDEELGDKSNMVLSLLSIGESYIKLKNFNKAAGNLERALTIAQEIKAKELIEYSYQNLSELYAAKKEYQKAFKYHKLYFATNESILNEKGNQQIAEMEVRYDTLKKEKEIAVLTTNNELLKKNEEIQKLRVSRERIKANLFIIGFLLLAIIFFLIFKRYLYLFAFWKKLKNVGQFRLMEKIASGAMGTIFKAHGLVKSSEIAAVKILRDEFFTDENSKKRFLQEAAIIDKLEHPHIVKIIERGQSRQSLFFAMEFLLGRTLEAKIKDEGPLPLTESLHIMQQICAALAFIHSEMIIHRDLKPANIMLVEKDGDANFVKLLDFGLAKMELQTRLTQSGNLVGTAEYMPPEQIVDSVFSQAGDIFSLGVIFYRMLCGQTPFSGETAIEIIGNIVKTDPVAIAKVRVGISDELNALVMSMLSKFPGQRPSAEDILKTLQHLAI